MQTSIIIVNYNTKEFLKECIDSIFKFESPDEFEIIIVDNASQDDSRSLIEDLKRNYSNINSIYINDLKGLSFANNRGIELSQGEYILLMNPDIVFESPVLRQLTDFLENNNNVGAIGPALFFPNGEFQKLFYQRYPSIIQYILFYSPFQRLFTKLTYLNNKYVVEDYIKIDEEKVFFVEHIPGAFILTKKKVLNQIGLMDENFVLFYEDVDLSYRIHNVYKVAVDTSLHVKHYGGSTTHELDWMFYGRIMTSMIYFFKKHYKKISYYTLKYIAISISIIILSLEKIYKIFGANHNIRIKRHQNFLNLVK